MKSIALYVRYVDDILIINGTTKINLHIINTYINRIYSNIKLIPTYEEHNSIAVLDLTITCRHTKPEVDIYRKPTTTDTKINFLSNHPIEQKRQPLDSTQLECILYLLIQTRNKQNGK